MLKAGVIGYPIAQSRSPLIHGYWLERHGIKGSYDRHAVTPEALEDFIAGLRENGFAGCNVTIPHKEAVLRLAAKVTPAARAIGAANTLWFEDGQLWADNTDAPGFLASLDSDAPGWDESTEAALVLGAGGAARGIIHALGSRGVRRIFLANRSEQRAHDLAAAMGSHVQPVPSGGIPAALAASGLLVNTTSLGMKGQPALSIDLSPLRPTAIVSDIIYAPLETDLVLQARARGLRVSPGLGMLLHQAVPGFERWFGLRPEVTPELRALVEADVRRAV